MSNIQSTQQVVDLGIAETRRRVSEKGRAEIVDFASFRKNATERAQIPAVSAGPVFAPPIDNTVSFAADTVPASQDMGLWEAMVDEHGTDIQPKLARKLADMAYDQSHPLVAHLREIACA
jgi:hypothetical protein